VTSLVFDGGGLKHEAGGLPLPLTSSGPPSALPVPMLSRRPSLGADAQPQASALPVGTDLFLLSLSYISQ
jgi:hypothetical protein